MTARSCVTISRYYSTRINSSLAFTLIWRCSWKEGRVGTLCRKAFDEVKRLTHITTVICCYYKQPSVPSSRQKNRLSFRNGILDPRCVVFLLCLLYLSFVMPCTRFFDGDSVKRTLCSLCCWFAASEWNFVWSRSVKLILSFHVKYVLGVVADDIISMHNIKQSYVYIVHVM